MNRSYSELSKLQTYEERFEYLKLSGAVGRETFGFDRYLNQAFYSSPEWRKARDTVIIRDKGCDLGIEGYEIKQKPIIHHLNAITKEQVLNRDSIIFDPENLITCTHRTHNAIHYGDSSQLPVTKERKPGDTKLW